MPHNMIVLYFHLPYFHVSNSGLFLYSTSVLSFYVDIVLKLSLDHGLVIASLVSYGI